MVRLALGTNLLKVKTGQRSKRNANSAFREMSSFWIGDKVLLKKSGRQGTVKEILSQNKLRVLVEGKIIITTTSNVTVLDDSAFEYPDWVHEPELKPEKSGELKTDHLIDLHMEKLEPSMLHESPSVILQYQIKQCRKFIENNVQKRRSVVHVICGKGEGVLRKEVIQIAKYEYDARFVFEKNEGGMLEIWL